LLALASFMAAARASSERNESTRNKKRRNREALAAGGSFIGTFKLGALRSGRFARKSGWIYVEV
jgi:hypothetical protein